MDHSSLPSFLLAVFAFLSPVFSSQVFPEWESWSWRLPSQRSQIPLVAEHRSHEEAPTLSLNNVPREISRMSRDSSNNERYFQYLNIPSQKVNFRTVNVNANYRYIFYRNTSLDGIVETQDTIHPDLNKEWITDSGQG